MHRLIVDPPYREIFFSLGWDSYQHVAQHFLPAPQPSAAVSVRRGILEDEGARVGVFFKQYWFAKPSWKFWLRASKARREFDNYGTFRRLGIPAAQRIACGEERDDWGRLKRAFILTRAVPESLTLVEFYNQKPRREQRDQITRQLARLTARLHRAHFYYYDLVWRNILVTLDSARKPSLWLIDCPRGKVAWLGRSRRQLRDLASLDKSAARFCRRTERLRFLLDYLGKERLDAVAKELARACLRYRQRRWPEDWS